MQVFVSLEKAKGHHLEMSKHLLESIGWSALFAYMEYEKHQRGKRFFQLLILVQLLCLPAGIIFDFFATKAHAHGAGIIVNDVPKIPFLERFEENRDLFSLHLEPNS